MKTTVEQVCPRERAGYRKFLKRAMRRMERRLAKKLGEDAPRRRPFRGYSD